MTVDFQVSSGADDAAEIAGVMDLVNLNVIDQPTHYQGLRWAVPGRLLGLRGATIDTAWLDLNINSSASDEPDHTIDFELAASPALFTTAANDISSRTGTTATAMLSHTNLLTIGQSNIWLSAVQTMPFPEIKDIIQEVVNAHGNAITHMVARLRGSAASNRDLLVNNFNFAPALAAILHIEFTPGQRKWIVG